MTRPLTVRDLRSLLRMHARRLEGATDELRRILVEERDALGALLGGDTVASMGDPSDASIHRLTRLIDVHAAARATAARDRSEMLAIRLASGCRRCSRGFALPLPWLDELVRSGGFATLVFRIDADVDRGIERTLLVALLRELRSVAIADAVITATGDLRVEYRGSRSRGGITLRAAPTGAAQDALVVDLGMLSPGALLGGMSGGAVDSRRVASAHLERAV